MADKLRPDELAAFKAAFDMFDKNQDGTISTKVYNIRRQLFFFMFLNIHKYYTAIDLHQFYSICRKVNILEV